MIQKIYKTYPLLVFSGAETEIVVNCLMFTSHDSVTPLQLLTNCNLTICNFESKHEIKNMTLSSVPLPLKTLKTKFEVIPPKDVEGDTF